ncbi:MAG TPA: methylated-DNA--[protein]-cysteine S-methyltransferase [Gemmatimonadales bacterium]
MTLWMEIPSPVGPLRLTSEGAGLTGVYLSPDRYAPREFSESARGESPVLIEAARQLDGYFAGQRQAFELPLAPAGTEFQHRVWTGLLRIPYGQTISYLELARRLGDERAVRAVGAANGRNPVSIIIPCHRVVGSNGSLVGYGGGLERKRWLLRHEVSHAALDFSIRTT